MKKIYILVTIIIIFFGIYLHILYFPKSYNLTYEIDKYKVQESYNKNNKMYKIIVNHNELLFPMIFSDDYNKNRKIVDKISIINNDNEICMSVYIKDNITPICYENEELKDFRLLSDNIKEEYSSLLLEYSEKVIDSYQNTNIYNYFDKDFYIWNYKGYDYINKEHSNTIDLLENDNYNNSLVFVNNRYILTPNYDQTYYFTEYSVIDNNKNELYNFDIQHEISYTSYYLGEQNNNIYLVDKKHKKQYKINIKKETSEIIGTEEQPGTIYKNNKWEKISLNKLANEEYSFPENKNYDYQIINKKLYLLIDKYMILLSNNDIKDIIYRKDDEIFYLVNDILYAYTPLSGEVKLLENSEWNFNYKNQIYIFD